MSTSLWEKLTQGRCFLVTACVIILVCSALFPGSGSPSPKRGPPIPPTATAARTPHSFPETGTWNAVINWTTIPSSGPAGRAYANFVRTDSSHALLFGGQGAGSPSNVLGDTWLLDERNGTWSQVIGSLHPAARAYAAAAFDPDAGLVVMFGGANSTRVFGDTWLFSPTNATWWMVRPLPAPSARFDASMAWDPGSHQILAFGGFGSLGPSSGPKADWWSFQPSSVVWANLTQSLGPPPRGGATLVEAAGVQGVLLFGGARSPDGGNPLNDTWQFNGTVENATQRATAQAPLPRAHAASCGALGGTIPYLFGGGASSSFGGNQEFNDSWIWGGGRTGWLVPSIVQGAPAGREGMSALWSTSFARCYFFGGLTSVGVQSTLYAAAIGGAQPLGVSLTGSTRLSLGLSEAISATAYGGVPPYTFSWTVNGSAALNGTTANFSFRPLEDGIFTLTVSVRDPAGESSSGTLVVDVQGPGPITVSVTLAHFSQSGSGTFSASVLGGTPPYQYEWTGGGGGSGWTSSSMWTSPALGGGTYLITVTVADSVGYHGFGTLTVHSNVVGSAVNNDLLLVGSAIAGVAAGATGGVLIALRRRRRGLPLPRT